MPIDRRCLAHDDAVGRLPSFFVACRLAELDSLVGEVASDPMTIRPLNQRRRLAAFRAREWAARRKPTPGRAAARDRAGRRRWR